MTRNNPDQEQSNLNPNDPLNSADSNETLSTHSSLLAFSQTLESEERKRGVRSFVIREGRMTDAQHRAFDDLWPLYGVDQLDDLTSLTHFKSVSLDIGFGNGESLIHAAQEEPDTLHIGVEVHRPGIGNLLQNIHQHQLENVRVINADAAQLVKLVPDNFIDRALIFFPDPWPKKRHHKRRLVKLAFIETIYPKIKQAGYIHLATDWQPYAEHILEVFSDAQLNTPCELQNIVKKPSNSVLCENTNQPDVYPFTKRPNYRPMTKYERRGVKLGHEVFDIIYQKTCL